MATERDAIKVVQERVRGKYLGRYSVLLRRLPGWDKSKLSRVLTNPNPKALELLTVCSAAGVMLGPILQGLHL